MNRHFNLTKVCSMDIQDTEKDNLFRVEVKDGDEVYILHYSTKVSRLVHDRTFFKCDELLSSPFVKRIETNCRKVIRRRYTVV